MIKIDSMHSKEYSLCSTFIHRADIWGYLLRAQHYKLCAAGTEPEKHLKMDSLFLLQLFLLLQFKKYNSTILSLE